MTKEEIKKLVERNEVLENELRTLCNHIMKIRRQVKKKDTWLSAGVIPYLPLTDEAQQGPLVTEMYAMVEEIRKSLRNK